MKIAALSDFHIGSTASNDSFGHSERDFHAFLDEVEATHEHIVLVGDVFQTEHGRTLSRASMARELRRATRRVGSLWRRFGGANYTYVHGNHDAIAAAELGAVASHRIEADGFAVHFTHGHQLDPFLRQLEPLARAGTWWMGRLHTLGLGRVAWWFEERDVAYKYDRFGGPAGPYAAGAERVLATEGVDVLVMGHTHVPGRVELPSGIYANTGTRRLRMVTSIDTVERSVSGP